MNIQLYKPSSNELWFKQQMLQDKETMSYNHAYGGTIPFPLEKWPQYSQKWLSNDPKHFYRYLKLKDEFIGEVAYYYQDDRCMVNVIIYAPFRHQGFGQQGLSLLLDYIKNMGINEVYDEIAIDNSSIAMFINNGFKIIDQDNEKFTVKKILNS